MITVLVATKNRPEKLRRCLLSIPPHVPVVVHGTAPTDLPATDRSVTFTYGPENNVQSYNLMSSRTSGDVISVPDDVEFEEGFFEAVDFILLQHRRCSVFGVHVTNLKCAEETILFVRREVIDSRGFFFDPRFEHFFVDNEFGRWARHRGVFRYCPEARLKHHHPCVSKEFDHTHTEGRTAKWHRDKAVWDAILKDTSHAPLAPIPQI